MSALQVSPAELFPLPKTLWYAACGMCDKLQSRWTADLRAVPLEPICAVCYLSRAPWATTRRVLVAQVIAQFQSATSRVFSLDWTGCPLHAEDADMVLMALATTERVSRIVKEPSPR